MKSCMVFVKRIKYIKDAYCYVCYTYNDEYVSVDEIYRKEDRGTLEKLGIDRIPMLLRINAYNTHFMPGYFGYVSHIDIRNELDDKGPYFAVGHYNNSVNQFVASEFFCSRSIYIKKLNDYRLYYLGARYSDEYGKFFVIRLYIPCKQTTSKLRHHLMIIHQLQKIMSESEYKDLKRTLNMKIVNDNIELTFYHAYYNDLVTNEFDFYNMRTTACTNLKDFKDPISFILSLYYSTKKYLEDGDTDDFVKRG